MLVEIHNTPGVSSWIYHTSELIKADCLPKSQEKEKSKLYKVDFRGVVQLGGLKIGSPW